MAIPAALSARAQDRVGMGGELATLRAEYNKLVTQLRVLTAKLDAASPAIIDVLPG